MRWLIRILAALLLLAVATAAAACRNSMANSRLPASARR
jgi:hypothetical protein